MNITIRQRKRAKDRASVYVEVYFSKGKVKNFTVGKIYTKPTSKFERLYNKEIHGRAEEMRIKLLTENSTLNLLGNDSGYSLNSNFLPFFKERSDLLKLEKRPQTYGAYVQFITFIQNKEVLFCDLKATLIEDFREFLLTKSIKKMVIG